MFKTIKNIIKWWPILKEDRDWDYGFLLEVLRFKLNNMADFFESKDACSVGSTDEAKSMRLCANYLRRLIEDEFFDFDYINQKWGEHELKLTESGRYHPHRPNVITDEDEIEYKKDLKEAFDEEDKARQQTLDNFCQVFKDRIFNWWD